MHAPEMPDQPESGVSNEDSLFLYCPYDRKITRHGRRWADRSIVCTECGNSVEVIANHRDFTPVARPDGVGAEDRADSRAEHAVRSGLWHNNQRPAWVLFGALGVVALFGVIAAIKLLGVPTWVQSMEEAVAATSNQPAAEVAGVSTPPQLFVANTGGTGVFLREAPEAEERIRAWPDGTVLKVVGDDQTVNGATWRNVEDPAGNRGWVPAQYISN